MARIVNLSEYRKARAPARPSAAAPDPAAHYFCLRCDTDQFKLFPSGAVNCARCGALMRNLAVSSSPSSQEADR